MSHGMETGQQPVYDQGVARFQRPKPNCSFAVLNKYESFAVWNNLLLVLGSGLGDLAALLILESLIKYYLCQPLSTLSSALEHDLLLQGSTHN